MPNFNEAALQRAHPPNPRPSYRDDGPDLHKLIPLAGGIVGVAERYKVKFVASNGAERTALCPFHAEKRPSFSVNVHKHTWMCRSRCGGGGVLNLIALSENLNRDDKAGAAEVLREMAGEPGGEQRRIQAEIAAAVAKVDTFKPLPLPPGAPEAPWTHDKLGKASARWPYVNADGELEGYMLRFDLPDGKQFRPLRWGIQEGRQGARWCWKGWGEGRPLYRLPEALGRPLEPLLVVEGEKSADAAAILFPDLVAVSPMGGSKAADKTDWTPVAGRRLVVWPDHDEAGEGFAVAVAEQARKAGAASVAVVTVPEGAPEKWDLADPLPDGWTVATLRAASDAAGQVEPVEPKGQATYADARAGRAPLLSSFPQPAPGWARDGTVKAQEKAIIEAVTAALAVAAVRSRYKRIRWEAARQARREMYAREIGPDEKPGKALVRRAAKVGKEAARIAGEAFMEARGLTALPPVPAPVAFGGSTGSGKTRSINRALAKATGGNIVVAFPTRTMALQARAGFLAERRAYINAQISKGLPVASGLSAFTLFGRDAPLEGGLVAPPRAGRKGHDFNRYGRYCEAGDDTKALIKEVQGVGSVLSTVCEQCPLYRAGCAYIEQIDEITDRDEVDSRVVFTTHAALLVEFPFAPDVVILDESFPAASTEVSDPEEPLLAGALDRVPAVRAALARGGEELATLRAEGWQPKDLVKAANAVEIEHMKEGLVIAAEAKAGLSAAEIAGRFRELRARRLQDVGAVLRTLAEEMETGRAGANGVRLEPRMVGGETVETIRLHRIKRMPLVRRGATAVIATDATMNPTLARLVYGPGTLFHDFAVEQAAELIQVTDRFNGTGRLWFGKDGERESAVRPAWDRIVRNVESLAALAHLRGGKLFVACTLKLRRQLEPELVVRGIDHLVNVRHFGALRGLNDSEECPVAYVIGRELPRVAAIEEMARAYATRSAEAFTPDLEAGADGFGWCNRPFAMRDGSRVLGAVRSHPDPIAAAVLEQAQEMEVEQAVGRIRGAFATKLVVLDCAVPTRLKVDRLVTGAELDWMVVGAGEIAKELILNGFSLAVWPGEFSEERGDRLIESLIRRNGSPHQIQASVAGPATGAHRRPATLYVSGLTEAEAWHRAVAVEPTLRRELVGGFIEEALRRTGVLCANIRALRDALPELLTDDKAAKSVLDAEQETVELIRAAYPNEVIRTGRRGKPPVVTYDPDNLGTAVAFLARHLGVPVTLEHYELTPAPPPIEPAPVMFARTARGWDFNLAEPLPEGDISEWFRWNPEWGPEPAPSHDLATLAA